MNKLCFGKIKMKANVTHFQKKEPIKVLKAQIAKTINTHHPGLKDRRTYASVKYSKKSCIMVFSTKEHDTDWLKQFLIGTISYGVDYASLKNKLLKSASNCIDFRLLGANKGVLTLQSQEATSHKLENGRTLWSCFFDEL